MLPLLKILAIFALIIFLLRRRYNIGIVMLAGAAVLGLAFGMEPVSLAGQMGATLVNPTTLTLTAILVLIMVLESVMRRAGMLEAMTGALFHLPLNRRLVFVSIPAIIGLLPSAGGARFSAPLVAQATAGVPYRAEDRVFINYWFRHVWEFSLPLYPGLILAAHISGVPLGTIILWQWPFTVTWAVLGYWYIFKLRGKGGVAAAVEGPGGGREGSAETAPGPVEQGTAAGSVRKNGGSDSMQAPRLRTLAASTWPLWVTVLLVLAHVPMLWALCGVLALLIAQKRYPPDPGLAQPARAHYHEGGGAYMGYHGLQGRASGIGGRGAGWPVRAAAGRARGADGNPAAFTDRRAHRSCFRLYRCIIPAGHVFYGPFGGLRDAGLRRRCHRRDAVTGAPLPGADGGVFQGRLPPVVPAPGGAQPAGPCRCHRGQAVNLLTTMMPPPKTLHCKQIS